MHACAPVHAQITGKKVSLFQKPLTAPAAPDEVAITAESLAPYQAASLLPRLSRQQQQLSSSLGIVRSGELPPASVPVDIGPPRARSRPGDDHHV